MNKFQKVINQIELFIKKYYKNQMLKGGILFLGLLLLSYLAVTGLEYIGHFGSGVRLGLLICFIGMNVFLLIRFLIVPLLKLNKLGKHLSLIDASDMIGKIFPDVGDKLKNTLQLNSDKSAEVNLELVNASIEQRSGNLSVVPFSTGIDLTENRQYLKYLIPIVLLFVLVAVISPNWFFDGSKRVINFATEYVEPAPFDFLLESDEEAIEGENYTLKIKLKGDEIPSEVKVYTNNGNYNLKQTSNVTFEHEFVNLSKELSFYCVANGFESKDFEVEMLHKPVIDDLSLSVVYPKHTGRAPEDFQNTGELNIPEGSIIEWNIGATNMSEMEVVFSDTTLVLNTLISNRYRFKKQFFESTDYLLALSSDDIQHADSIFYKIGVVKDEYPSISIQEEVDSTNSMRRFIEGRISDDYGFRGLNLRVTVTGKDTTYSVSKRISLRTDASNQLFSFMMDVSQYDLKPGDKLDYVFTVTDNDELNGFKSRSSSRKFYEVPEFDELENQIGEKDDQLKDKMDEATKDAKELRDEIKEVKSEMVNKPNLDWKDKQSLENLMEMQKKLENNIKDIQKDFEENKEEKENFLENSEELKQKQEELQKLMEELMDDELKELFEELQKLMEEMNKDELVENLEEMEQNAEDMEEELDRTLELFKNMELDQKLENLEEQLKALAEEQEALKEKSENKEMSEEELAKEQEKLNEKFDEIRKDMDEIEEKNQELESPRDMDFDEEMEEEIDSEMQDSKESLDSGKQKQSEKSQGKAADMMKQMAEDVAAMKQAAAEEQAKEDMDALRFLLENLINLSYTQEDLMDTYGNVRTDDPYYLQLNRDQLEISKSTVIVNDSLVALSKRVSELSFMINEELNELSYNLDKSLLFSEERKTGRLMQHQQYSMTSYNNLALMLSEVLDQMQQQMKNQKPGSGSCDNPGGSGKGKSGKQMSMEEMKQALSEQIAKMKGGKKPGGEEGKGEQGEGKGETPGGTSGGIPQLSSKEIAKMAAEQGRLREGLKQLKQELNKDGSGAGNGLDKLIEDLDKLQTDLINGNVGSDFVKRQEDIYTRLLESEKAMRERGYSEEREAKEGKNDKDGNLKEFTEYNKKKDAEIEFLRSLPVGLQVYYKGLVNEYFNSVNN
ncbi:MAG: hypothetical protein GQ574_09890 [Crocinitomix sp.]|nr:hypothetical protein [Crocinitomix sp.]